MNKYIAVTVLLANFSIFSADWLDLLVQSIGANNQWNFEQVTDVINQTLAKDLEAEEKRLALLEKKYSKTESGFWGMYHAGGYKTEITTLQTSVNYQKKVIAGLNKINSKQKKQTNFTKSLNKIYEKEKNVEQLKLDYQKSDSWASSLKIGSLITIEQTKIAALKSKIKGDFLLFD